MVKAKKKDAPQGRDFDAPDSDNRRREDVTTTNGEVPAHFDAGGEAETDDGLDEYQEATRHGAEDVPASERRKKMSDLPVFDRAETKPKI